MEMQPASNNSYKELALSQINLSYSSLRLVDPKADKAIERSLRQYGQIMPVIVGRNPENKYEMVDGFKRFRACEHLGCKNIQAKLLEGHSRILKAAIITLNARSRSIDDFEKGLIILSLHREEGMRQDEIALLLGHHKSWVCRRLLLVERLNEDVQEHFKLGLINISSCRQLAQLPRGNQQKALKTILKYQFTSHEVVKLVSILMKNPKYNHENILNFPEQILNDRSHDPPRQRKAETVNNRLIKIEDLLDAGIFNSENLPNLEVDSHDVILSTLKKIEDLISRIRAQFTARF